MKPLSTLFSDYFSKFRKIVGEQKSLLSTQDSSFEFIFFPFQERFRCNSAL